jgi:hypothetical protein
MGKAVAVQFLLLFIASKPLLARRCALSVLGRTGLSLAENLFLEAYLMFRFQSSSEVGCVL